MNGTILVVYLLIGRGDIAIQYAERFETNAQCEAARVKIEKLNDPLRDKWAVPYAKWKYSECVIEKK